MSRISRLSLRQEKRAALQHFFKEQLYLTIARPRNAEAEAQASRLQLKQIEHEVPSGKKYGFAVYI